MLAEQPKSDELVSKAVLFVKEFARAFVSANAPMRYPAPRLLCDYSAAPLAPRATDPATTYPLDLNAKGDGADEQPP